MWEIALSFVFAIVFSLAFYFGIFNTVENSTIDFRFRERGELPRNHDIVLVSIDDESIAKIGTWPWPRATHAKLLNKLKEAGAKTVAFDLMFDEPSVMGKEDDEAFVKAVKNFGSVVLPQVVHKTMVLDNDTFEMKEKTVVARPIKQLRYPVSQEGFIDIEYQNLNPDGVIRKLVLLKDAGDIQSEIFGIVIASAYLNLEPKFSSKGCHIGDRFLPYYDCYEPKAHRTISSYMLNYAGGTSHFDEINYLDVLNGNYPDDFFNNRLVLVGTRAKGTSEDVKFSPFGAMSGMEIHANLLYDILNRKVLRRSSVGTTITFIFLIAMGLGYILWQKRGAAGNIAAILCWILWPAIGVILFKFDFVIEITPITILLPIQWSVTRLTQQFVSLRQTNYELSQKVCELAIVNEVSRAVSFMGNLPKTLDAILDRAVKVLNASRGSLFMLDDQYETLIEKAVVYGIDGDTQVRRELKEQFKEGQGIAGEVFSSGKPRLIKNARQEKAFTQKDKVVKSIRTMICVPLMVKDNAIGVMNIINKKNGIFGDEDLQLCQTIANQAAVVIEKARLFNLATIDGLTGLIVHRHFQAKMEEEFRRAKRYGKPLSFLMTDIDHFKKFNDTWGHQIGDVVLRGVAKCVMDTVRDIDIAARYGGEEFAVILPETDLEGAKLLAERLRVKVEEASFQGPKGELKVTISLGLSTIPDHQAETATEMIKLADEALYIAKDNGRNQVGVASSKMITGIKGDEKDKKAENKPKQESV